MYSIMSLVPYQYSFCFRSIRKRHNPIRVVEIVVVHVPRTVGVPAVVAVVTREQPRVGSATYWAAILVVTINDSAAPSIYTRLPIPYPV